MFDFLREKPRQLSKQERLQKRIEEEERNIQPGDRVEVDQYGDQPFGFYAIVQEIKGDESLVESKEPAIYGANRLRIVPLPVMKRILSEEDKERITREVWNDKT